VTGFNFRIGIGVKRRRGRVVRRIDMRSG